MPCVQNGRGSLLLSLQICTKRTRKLLEDPADIFDFGAGVHVHALDVMHACMMTRGRSHSDFSPSFLKCQHGLVRQVQNRQIRELLLGSKLSICHEMG